MLEISSYAHDAVMEVKNIRGVAKGGSSIIQAVGGTIHSVNSEAGDLD